MPRDDGVDAAEHGSREQLGRLLRDSAESQANHHSVNLDDTYLLHVCPVWGQFGRPIRYTWHFGPDIHYPWAATFVNDKGPT